MSHYDCTACGYPMGISYGECDNCTPKEVKDVIRELDSVYYKAEVTFNNSEAHKEYNSVKHKFIEKYVSEVKKKHEKLFKLHHPNNKK